MRVVLQKVKWASCKVDNVVTGKIEHGYMLLVGFTNGDNIETLKKAVKKIAFLRVFQDELGKMNLDLNQVKGSILSISQFTLYACTSEGNRPSFKDALNPDEAKILYQEFNNELRKYNFVVEEGIFGAHMEIELLNDGPTTICYEF